MIIFYIFGIFMFGIIIYTSIKYIGTPKGNTNIRTKKIEEEVASIDGIVEKIETSKSSCYPYTHELNLDDGSYHVFYKITYKLNEEVKEGWAVLKLQQSLVGPVGATTNEWIWKL